MNSFSLRSARSRFRDAEIINLYQPEDHLNSDCESFQETQLSLDDQPGTSSNSLASFSSLLSSLSTQSEASSESSEFQVADYNQVRIDGASDHLNGLLLLISKAFQASNLSGKSQKRIYELIKIVNESNCNLVSYNKFLSVLESFSPINVYSLYYCLSHKEFVSRKCCSNNIGEIVIFSLIDTLRNIIEKDHSALSSVNASGNVYLQSRSYEKTWQGHDNDNALRLTLIVNIDDAQMCKSSKVSTTPIPFIVAELPQHKRFKKTNVYNFAVYHGAKGFPVNILVEKSIIEPLRSLQVLIVNDRGNYVYSNQPLQVDTKFGIIQIFVRIGLFILDSVAKSKFMNIKSFMGYNGCPYCLIPGQVIRSENSSRFVYQFEEDTVYQKKTKSFYETASLSALTQGFPYQGVKGPSILSDLIDIPDNIPIDYMHCILEGVFKHLVKQKPYKNVTVTGAIDNFVNYVQLPHDFGRKFRKISEIQYWKASECRTFLLYLVMFFRDLVDDDSFLLILSLSSVTRIYSNPFSSLQELQDAESLVQFFLISFQEIYGIEQMRFNLHLFSHLPSQYELFGCLCNTSAFVFESNVFSLKRSFHGTRGHVSQMSKSYAITKGLESQKSTLHHWQYKLDPNNRLLLSTEKESIYQKIIGKFDQNFEFSQRQITLLRNRNISLETVKVFHRFSLNHQEYHSYNYKYKRNSNSFTISYRNASKNIGKIVAFLAIYNLNVIQKFFAIIEPYQIMTSDLVKKLKPTLAILKRMKSIQSIDSMYVKCKDKNLPHILIETNNIVSKAIVIPDINNTSIMYSSFCDLPFEHD